MKKILLPIDFTTASRSAFEYVLWLSQMVRAEVVVIHVYKEPLAKETLPTTYLEKFQRREEQLVMERLKRFTAYYPNARNEKELAVAVPTLRLKRGDTIQAILECAQEEEADLIVIGTRKKHNFFEYLFGSISSKLLTSAQIPVLVIPEGTIFEPIEHIAFATELDLHEEVSLLRLHDFAKKIGANVHQFFVNQAANLHQLPKEEVSRTTFNSDFTNSTFGEAYATVTMIRDTSILNGIHFYLENHPTQILSMFLPARSVWESLFHISQTKKMVFDTKVPLLVFPET